MPKEETMSILYTKITFQNNEELIILNREFTKQQVKERMIQNGHTKNYAESIVRQAIYTDNPHMVTVKAVHDDKAVITKVYEGGTEYIKEIVSTIHIFVNPDATWDKKQTFWERLLEAMKK